jgi:multidrug efflux pump
VNLSEPFIRRPVATVLFMVAVVLLGILGYQRLPVAALPAVDFPTIEVSTVYPGASPEVMSSAVTTPLERQFGQISGLTSMSSVSGFGRSAITLQFALDRDIDSAGQDVQAAINTASGYLPRGLPAPPVYNKVNPADSPILTIKVTSDTLPLERVNDFADTVLAQKLSQVSGVGLVTLQGHRKPAIRVRVNPSALAVLGFGMEDVRAAIVAANLNAPKGSFDGVRQNYVIGTNDQMTAAQDYQKMIIAYRNGAPVRIGDIGEAVDDVEDVRMAAWVDGRPASILDVRRQPGANIIETADRVKRLLPQLRAAIPPQMEVAILSDRTETIRASVKDVEHTMILTIGLVVFVIFAFLRRVWATVIPSIALPIAIVGTFGVMYLLGFSLNNLSLMALTISTGFVVDDAIVMIENIFRYIEEGVPPFEAALKGARQIGFTVISLSISLVAVFIPLLFMSGIVGRLFREFAVTLSIAVGVSAVVSLTLTPMMCARLLKPHRAVDEGWFYRVTERFFELWLSLYRVTLGWVMRHRAIMSWITVATVVGTLWMYVEIPKGLLPVQDTGVIVGVVDAAENISFRAMADKQRAVTERIRQDSDVASVAAFLGSGPGSATSNSGQIYIVLKSRSERQSDAKSVIDRLRITVADVPGVTLFMQAVQDLQIDSRVSRTQFQYIMQGPDERELGDAAIRLREGLRARVEFADVATDQQEGGYQLKVDVSRDKAALLGVTMQAVDDTLYDAFGQRQVSVVFTQSNQYRVILEADTASQLDAGMLDRLQVRATQGGTVPLSAFATLSQTNAPLSVQHAGQFPSVTLSFNLASGYSLGDAVEALGRVRRDVAVPASVAGEFVGSAAEFKRSLADSPFLLLAAIVVIYIVLGVLYESYIHPITILSSLPSAGIGALAALRLANMDLSIIAIIGIVLLIGIVKKNAIMMIDFAIEKERDHGTSPERAILEACELRFRPIMMTTMAALLGAVPLALENGMGSELRKPLGVCIIGGLVVSQFLTLYTTPVIYLAMDRVAAWFRRFRPEGVRVEEVVRAESV